MALNTYGKKNYEVIVPISIEYTKETVHPASGQYGSTGQWKYGRHVTKTYRFKGMDATTATACLTAKRKQYNRKFMGWKFLGNNWRNILYYERFGIVSSAPADYYEQVATFNVTRNGSVPTFDVQITVDEVVYLYFSTDYNIQSSTDLAIIESLFQRSSTSNKLCYVSTYDYDENLT